jgi:hypothetical protein
MGLGITEVVSEMERSAANVASPVGNINSSVRFIVSSGTNVDIPVALVASPEQKM